jgi:hypothetical protein
MYDSGSPGDLAYPGFLRRVAPHQPEKRAFLLRQLLSRLLPRNEKLRLAREDEATLPRLQVEHPLLESIGGDQHVLRVQSAALSLAGILDGAQKDREAGADDERQRHAGKKHPLRYPAGVPERPDSGRGCPQTPGPTLRQHCPTTRVDSWLSGAVHVIARSQGPRDAKRRGEPSTSHD